MMNQSDRTNELLNVIKTNNQMLTKFIYMSKIHSNQSINCLYTGKKVGIKYEKIPKPFIDYSQTINDVYENLKDYNPTKEKKVLTVFDDMI